MHVVNASRRSFSAPQLCALTGLSYRQVDYWCRIGLLVPFVPANGSGTQRRFDEREVRVARALAVLASMSAPLQTIGMRVAEQLRWLAEDDGVWSSLVFVSSEGHVLSSANGSGWLLDLSVLDLELAVV